MTTANLPRPSVTDVTAPVEPEAARRNPPQQSLVVTVLEAAELLQLDPRTVRAMVKSGELAGNQHGNAIRISRASVEDWAEGRRRDPRSKARQP